MSKILYYSNYCDNSKKLISILSKSKISKDIHFICIDKRIKKSNNVFYIQLENGQEILLPSIITKVPALLLLNNNNEILYGNDIYNYLNPREKEINNNAVNNQGEPSAFSFYGNSVYGVSSDLYSYLDQNSDDLSAKGNGGMRQMYNYCGIDQYNNITTPDDEYQADKIGDVSLEKLKQERNNDLNINNR